MSLDSIFLPFFFQGKMSCTQPAAFGQRMSTSGLASFTAITTTLKAEFLKGEKCFTTKRSILQSIWKAEFIYDLD